MTNLEAAKQWVEQQLFPDWYIVEVEELPPARGMKWLAIRYGTKRQKVDSMLTEIKLGLWYGAVASDVMKAMNNLPVNEYFQNRQDSMWEPKS